MSIKRRFNVSLADHVADAVEKSAKVLQASPTEYAGDIIRWWFGQGCPALTEEEALLHELRQESGKDLKATRKPDVTAYFAAKKKEFEEQQVWLRRALKEAGYEETTEGKWFKADAKKAKS